MKTIRTSTEIEASSQRIWQVITDNERYPEWHPTIWMVEGRYRPGEQLTFHIQKSNRRSNVRKIVEVLKVIPPSLLVWREHGILPSLLDGTRTIKIDTNQHKHPQFIQEMAFSGLLVPFLSKRLETRTRNEFNKLAQALKGYLEGKKAVPTDKRTVA